MGMPQRRFHPQRRGRGPGADGDLPSAGPAPGGCGPPAAAAPGRCPADPFLPIGVPQKQISIRAFAPPDGLYAAGRRDAGRLFGIVAAVIRGQLLVDSNLIEPPAAGQVVAVKAQAGEHPAGQIAAQAGVAVDIDRFVLGQLPCSLTQLIQRDMEKACDLCPLPAQSRVRTSSNVTLPSRGSFSTSSQKKFFTLPVRVFSIT